MAEYRLSYKIGKLGYAKSHAEYILREGNYTSKKEDLIYKEYGNMNFIDGTSAVKFWEYADTYERANSIVYREIELNIPNEFNHEQAKELIANFVKKELGDGYPYTYAIHESFNKDNEKNLHCHLMFSERELDGIDRDLDKFFKRANSKRPALGGAKKNREWQTKDRLKELRKSWEIEQNNLLEKHGFEVRVDCRSLRDIRKDLLEKEMFDLADKYNREPLNISGKILYKVDKKIPLNEIEQAKYDNFLKTKKIRLEKINGIEKKDLKKEIEQLEKQDSKERALNIISKGEYFKLKKNNYTLSNKLKIYPQNQTLINSKSDIETAIKNIKNKWENHRKFIGIVEQLEKNKEREIQQLKEQFKEKFNENYLSENEQKFIDKYQKYDTLKLKIRYQNLLNEETEEKAINIITNYKYNNELIEIFNIQKNIENIEKKYQEASLYNPVEIKELKVQREELFNNVENKKNAIREFINNIDDIEVKNLSKKIENSKKIELDIIKKILDGEKKTFTDLDYEKERLALLNKHSTLEKLYIKENTKIEKNSKKMYSIAQDILAIESLLNNEYQERKEIKDLVRTNLEKIEKKIARNNNRIEVSEKVLKKTTTIKNAFNKKHNITGIEIIAIGRLSKNEYWKLYKKQENLKKEIEQKEKAFSSMGIMSFGKNVLKKNIELNKKELATLELKERELVSKYRKLENFENEVQKIKIYLDKTIKNYENIPYVLKEENKINYKLKSNIIDRKKIVKTNKELVYHKNKQKSKGNFIKDFNKNLNKILAADLTEIHSNLDINLEKERGNEWEI